jgi:membrane protein DedA with SNARE-associated domain
VLHLASISDSLVNVAVHIIRDLGLPGIFLLMAFDATGIPFPSEATMMFAGFNVFQGHNSLVTVCIAGILGDLAGASLAYAIGYFGRVDLIEKHGRKVLIKPHHLKKADDWFERYGDATVFFSRMLPIIRTFISLPAGVARMPFWKFTILTLAGCVPWIFMLTFIGREVGANWEDWKNSLRYVDYTVAALIVVGLVYLVVRWRRNRNRGRPADAPV